MTHVGVVVVTYESGAVLPDLLADLRVCEPGARVVVVDNASPSGPPVVHAPAELKVLDRNRGYGTACNVGAQVLADVTHLAFLNPDIRLSGPSLTQLAEGLAARPEAGIATGPVVDPAGNRVPTAWGRTTATRALWFALGWRAPRLRAAASLLARAGRTSLASSGAEEMEVDGHVLGGAMVIDARSFTELGGFDEEFFMFWEDADICHRARRAGWHVHLLPCIPIVHAAGTSSAGVTDDQRWRWYVEGADRFARKHLSVRQRVGLRTGLAAGHALRSRRTSH